MYARVVSWEGGTADDIRRMVDSVNESEGPPEGVPATGFTFLVDRQSGRSLAITLFASEEDMRTGHETLEGMSPPGDSQLRRVGVEFYEAPIDVRV